MKIEKRLDGRIIVKTIGEIPSLPYLLKIVCDLDNEVRRHGVDGWELKVTCPLPEGAEEALYLRGLVSGEYWHGFAGTLPGRHVFEGAATRLVLTC